MDQYIGKFLDNRYELLEVIGTGGMAVVYKARCHRLNRLVAVKVLKADLAQDAEFRRRFHDESQAVAMLSHPNIVAVYDVSHSNDLDYIVMELIDGITLKQYIQKKGAPLNWREALHFITQIMRALSHAHSRGIIHRDIKPHNIMVLRDGSVKVSDFGIARIASAGQSTLTQEALGSVHYISPEQARGSHTDARSDIYSAGVVLYEMITGRLPFEGETPVAVAIQHINSIPLSPRELNPDIPEALEEITMRAMAPNPDDRYLSADDMLVDLEEFRKNPNINFDYTPDDLKPCDEPTRPVPTGGGHGHSREPVQRRDAEGDRGRKYRREDQERRPRRREEKDMDEEYEDDRRGPVWPILVAVGAIVVFIGVVIWFLWSSFFNGIVNPVGESIPVPNLVGKTLTEIYADTTITDRFTIEEGDLIPSEEYEAGQVVRQDPEADEMVKGENLTITVDISAGTDEMTIPPVENMEQRVAMELLRDKMGLVVSQELEESDITKGYAIRTDLPVGTPVKKGDTVTLVISTGPKVETVMVTAFVDQPLSVVQEHIFGLELTLGEVKSEPSEKEAGTVLWQSLPAGTAVPKGTAIDLTVSTGQPVESPSVSPSEEPSVSPSEEPSVPPSDQPPTQPPPVSSEPTTAPTPPVETPPVSEEPTTAPSPSQPVMGSKSVSVSLPAADMESDTVRIRIEVDGVVKKDETVSTALFPISPQIQGSGTQQVSVFVNDVLINQYMETFS